MPHRTRPQTPWVAPAAVAARCGRKRMGSWTIRLCAVDGSEPRRVYADHASVGCCRLQVRGLSVARRRRAAALGARHRCWHYSRPADRLASPRQAQIRPRQNGVAALSFRHALRIREELTTLGVDPAFSPGSLVLRVRVKRSAESKRKNGRRSSRRAGGVATLALPLPTESARASARRPVGPHVQVRSPSSPRAHATARVTPSRTTSLPSPRRSMCLTDAPGRNSVSIPR